VSRPTGGKGVLHGHDVTVGLAANLDDLGVESGNRRVATVYRIVVGVLVDALNDVGLRCALAERTEFVRNVGHTADCFSHVSPNDVVDPATGHKVCGCALRVTDTGVLLQASIPVAEPLVDPALVFVSAHQPGAPKALQPSALADALRTFGPVRVVQSVV
jgi:lipoate-protein ligase A